jgi:2-dehydropantoate 2-reductase
MNIAIIGPGAIGLLLAGYLNKTGANITLVDHLPDRADKLNADGIRWEGKDADFRFRVPVTMGIKDPDKKDLAILCVKAYSTDAATRELHQSGYRGPVLTLQNGVGNVEIISRNLPGSPLIAGITSEGANLADAAHVRHGGKGKTFFGPIEHGRPDREFLDRLASIMRTAGLDVELSNDPQSLIWSKLLVNAGINALTAIFMVRNGQLVEVDPARRLMSDLVLEGWEVVRRKKIKPVYEDPVAHVEEVCRRTAANYSSLYMDMKEGRQTEIDFINGAIVREGAALGLPCPRNDMVAKIVRGLELLRVSAKT